MIEEFLDYLQYEKRFSLHTVTAYKNDIEQYDLFCKENVAVSLVDIKPKQIRYWIAELIDAKNKPTSIKRKISAVNTFYKFLQKKGMSTSNPAKGIYSPKVEERLPQYVEQKNLSEIFNSDKFETLSQQDKIIISLLYATGMRRQELIQLQWRDVNFHEKQIKITGKGNKQRLIPVSIDTLEGLKVLRMEQRKSHLSEYVFCTEKGEMLYANYVYRLIKEQLSTVPTLSKKSPHILRHSFATHLANNGAPLNDIKALLGHASLASTQVYTHNTIEQLKEIYKIAHPKA